MTQRIGKTPESELNEIAEESYRQITGNKRKSVRELQTNKEKMDRIRAEIVRLVDAAEIICQEIRQGGSRCPLGDSCSFHAALKKNRPFGCEVSGCIQVFGMPTKKGSAYPVIEEDIRIPIDSQTNYK